MSSTRQPFQPRETTAIRDENQPRIEVISHDANTSSSRPFKPKHPGPRSHRSLQSNQSHDTPLKSRKSLEGIQRPTKAIFSKPPPPRGSLTKQRQLSPRKSQNGRTLKSNLLLPGTSPILMRLPRSNRADSVHAIDNHSLSSSSLYSVPESDDQSVSYVPPSIIIEEPEEENIQSSANSDDLQAYHSSTHTEPQTFSQPALPTISAIDSIFELDTNAYVEMHMKEYNEEKLKWATCSMDDWVKGADGASFSTCALGTMYDFSYSELASEFSSLLDFVSTFCH